VGANQYSCKGKKRQRYTGAARHARKRRQHKKGCSERACYNKRRRRNRAVGMPPAALPRVLGVKKRYLVNAGAACERRRARASQVVCVLAPAFNRRNVHARRAQRSQTSHQGGGTGGR